MVNLGLYLQWLPVLYIYIHTPTRSVNGGCSIAVFAAGQSQFFFGEYRTVLTRFAINVYPRSTILNGKILTIPNGRL